MDIDELSARANAYANLKGFWSRRKHDGQLPSIGEKLMLVVCEVAEAMEEVRKVGFDPSQIYYVDGKPEGFPIELADAVIRICDVAGELAVPLKEAIDIKMEYNEGRPYLHGKTL